jgi:hypothetical protein
MARIKLQEYCERRGISQSTGLRWFKEGLIPGAFQAAANKAVFIDETEMEFPMSENNAMSHFLRKTVEFAKNNATVEDFAAYVVANFSLKFSATSEEKPQYSKNKPSSTKIQGDILRTLLPLQEKTALLKNLKAGIKRKQELIEQGLDSCVKECDRLGIVLQEDDRKNLSLLATLITEYESSSEEDKASFRVPLPHHNTNEEKVIAAPLDHPVHDFGLKQTETSLSIPNQDICQINFDGSLPLSTAAATNITIEATDQITLKAPKVKIKKTAKKKGTSNVKS